MTRFGYSIVALGVLTVGLSACGGGDSSSPPAAAQVATAEGKFGACFATKFDAQANTKATDPVPCTDLPALSLTTKPNPL